MAIFSIPDIRLAGVAASVPRKEYNNRDYEWITPREREVLIKTVGVERRRVAEEGMTTSDLCYEAARKLISGLGWQAGEIDLLVFVSQSRDYLIPATAGILQDRLGLPKTCMAFDISLGCSGYVYGLSVMGRMMSGGAIRKGLLLVGDVSTQNTSYKDKSTFPLFGDAGTATALEYQEGAGPMDFNLQTDGSGYRAIIIPDGGIRNLAARERSFEYEEIAEGIIRNRYHIALDGLEVFNFSLREVAANVRSLLQHAGAGIDDIDFFVMHQANRLMNETIRKQLKIVPEKYPYSLRLYGNTSSASIPLTFITQLGVPLGSKRLRLLLSGFGVGLSWGSALLTTDHVFCPEIIEM